VRAPDDTAAVRKARGAFFTPEPITRFIADWAIRSWDDRVLEPSAGDAAFLVEAVRRLRELGVERPKVEGIEIHDHSARIARRRIREAGGSGRVSVSDFFEVAPRRHYDAVIGNPPYLRYQDWSGSMRERSRTAALRAGVRLTGLASSWAAFTVQSAMFLREGGRLGLVLPAELLSVNYAAPVRRFLFEHFRSIDLILFEKQVFEDAEADTLLLLADGYLQGATDHARVRQVFDAHHLGVEGEAVAWSPVNSSDKWVGSLTKIEATHVLDDLARTGDMVGLRTWGKTSLGIVTGNNRYFALTTERINELGLESADLIPLSPPGSGHLRELDLDRRNLTRLAEEGSATWLFRPQGEPSPAARAYIAQGERMGVHRAYKCRVRSTWWRVPYLRPADLLLTYMNADAVRIVTNAARVHHLNSVHGIYLEPELDAMGRDLLPLASLNSVTMLSGELTGRSYGGGILKMEPREADRWLMPSPDLVWSKREELQRVRRVVLRQLREGQLRAATHIVDEILFGVRLSTHELADVRDAHEGLQSRRTTRSKRG
jgi:adenine-specific DNA methylase